MCGCNKQAQEGQEWSDMSSVTSSEGSGSDKENVPMPEPDHNVKEPPLKKRKE